MQVGCAQKKGIMNAEEIRRLRDELYIAEIRYARTMPPGEKLLEGIRMFDRECQIARMAVREACPDASDERIEELLFSAVEKFDNQREANVMLT